MTFYATVRKRLKSYFSTLQFHTIRFGSVFYTEPIRKPKIDPKTEYRIWFWSIWSISLIFASVKMWSVLTRFKLLSVRKINQFHFFKWKIDEFKYKYFQIILLFWPFKSEKSERSRTLLDVHYHSNQACGQNQMKIVSNFTSMERNILLDNLPFLIEMEDIICFNYKIKAKMIYNNLIFLVFLWLFCLIWLWCFCFLFEGKIQFNSWT